MIDLLIHDITAGAWAIRAEAIYGRLPLVMNILQQNGKPEGVGWGQTRKINLPYQVKCNSYSACPNNTANHSEDQPKKIMVIPIHGVITKYDQLFQWNNFIGNMTQQRLNLLLIGQRVPREELMGPTMNSF